MAAFLQMVGGIVSAVLISAQSAKLADEGYQLKQIPTVYLEKDPTNNCSLLSIIPIT